MTDAPRDDAERPLRTKGKAEWWLPGNGSLDAIRADHEKDWSEWNDPNKADPSPYEFTQIELLLREIDARDATIRALTQERDKFKRLCAEWRESHAELHDKNDDLQQERDGLRAALQKHAIRWTETFGTSPERFRRCYECGARSSQDDCANLVHQPTCALASPQPDAGAQERACTCHPSEAPVPCQHKYAFSECVEAAADSSPAGRDDETIINGMSQDGRGHGDPCWYCAERCDSVAANPGLWPLLLPLDNARPGYCVPVHTNCVLDRLNRADEKIQSAERATLEKADKVCADFEHSRVSIIEREAAIMIRARMRSLISPPAPEK